MAEFTPPSDWLAKTPVHTHVGSFTDLGTKRLPQLQKILSEQIKHAMPLALFLTAKTGVKNVSKLREDALNVHLANLQTELQIAKNHTTEIRTKLGKEAIPGEFTGVYVFISTEGPFYVGISRTVLRRLKSHVRSRTHHAASLFFNMAREDAIHKGRRGDLKLSSDKAISIQSWLRRQSVAILPLACPVERYAFELYASMELQTGRWNTFETH